MIDYKDKSKEELAYELMLRDAIDEERGISDRRYAMKIVERIVFAMLALIFLTVLGAIVNLVVNTQKPDIGSVPPASSQASPQ